MKCDVERWQPGEAALRTLPEHWRDRDRLLFAELERLCGCFGLRIVALDAELEDTAIRLHPQQHKASLPLSWPQGHLRLTVSPGTGSTPLNQALLNGIHQSLQAVITAHQQAMEAQNQAERWQQALYNTFAVWDWDGLTRQFHCSQEWTNLLGLPYDTIRSVRTLLKRVHPADRNSFRTALKKVFSGSSEMLDCELRFRHAWEDYIWLRTRAKITDHDAHGKALRIIGTSVNITMRKKAEEEIYDLCQQLNNSEVLYRELMKHASDAILIVDKQDGRIIDANHHASDLSGYTLKELLGKQRTVLLQTPDGECIPCVERGLIHDMRLIGKNGQQHIVDISCTTINVSGRPLAQCIIHDISEHKAIEQRLHHLAHHDPLTGLPNRILFRDRLQQAIYKAQRKNTLLALCFFDLDHFKAINDSYGHDAGDLVLTTIAERLSASIRASDTAARLGGDEFIVLFEEIEQLDTIQPIATKILKRISEPISIDGHQVRVTSSLGISIYPRDTQDSDTLLNLADTAMYRAKSVGNCLEFHALGDEPTQEKLDLWPK